MDWEQLRRLIEVAAEHDEGNRPLLDAINEWVDKRDE